MFGRWRCWSRLIGGRCRSRAVGQHLSRAGRLRVAACRPRLTTTGLLPVAAMPRGPAMPRLSLRADERHAEHRDQTRQRQEFSRHGHSFQHETFVTNTSGLQLRSPRFILKHSRGARPLADYSGTGRPGRCRAPEHQHQHHQQDERQHGRALQGIEVARSQLRVCRSPVTTRRRSTPRRLSTNEFP